MISVLVRRLREGKTYQDFREAWLPEQGFGFPTRVVSAQGVEDEHEIITIGFSELDEAEAEAQLQRIGPQEQRHPPSGAQFSERRLNTASAPMSPRKYAGTAHSSGQLPSVG